jgi:hypothetical protein
MLPQDTRDLLAQLPAETQRQVLELLEQAITTDSPGDLARELEFLLGVEVSESSFGEWEDSQAAFLASCPGSRRSEPSP